MNNHKIINLGMPANSNDAVNKSYVETLYNDPNIFIGHLSGNNTVTGQLNVGLGPDSLSNISIGLGNIAIGSAALTINTTGGKNIATDFNALQNSTILSNNIALGDSALKSLANTGLNPSIAIGVNLLMNMSSFMDDIAIGN